MSEVGYMALGLFGIALIALGMRMRGIAGVLFCLSLACTIIELL